jgi:cyclophilin family peptidyl-prolyl cis-trans isomerase
MTALKSSKHSRAEVAPLSTVTARSFLYLIMRKNLLLTFFAALSCVAAFAQYNGKPIYDIEVKRNGTYVGTITVELFPAVAPNHVHNFDSLVSEQFYDSTAFHRVIPGFMIQGGDPNSRSGPRSTWGMGDPNQPTVNAEFTAAKHVRGRLSAARDVNPNSANSQFFICVATAGWLDGQYSVYGRVVAGMNIVDTVVFEPRDSVDNPYQKMEMFITFVGENDTLATVPVHSSPANFSSSNSTSRVISWQAQSDAVLYNLQVSTDSTFATTHADVTVGNNTRLVSGLTLGQTYYWRVRSNNGGDTSAFSQWWCFNTSPTGIETHTESNVVTVAPNPSQGQFTFSNLTQGSTVEIFDVTGKWITSAAANSATCSIDLAAYGAGVYFYVISSAGETVQGGKLIVE